MRILVTGGTGFIGSHFLQAAVRAGHEIIAVKRPGSETKIPLAGKMTWIIEPSFGDLVPERFEGIDVLVHLAAAGVTPQPASWPLCYSVNVTETVRLLETAHTAGVKRAVVAGTYAEYGLSGLRHDPIPPDAPLQPTDIYAASKASGFIAASTMARIKQWELAYLRVFSAFGDGQHASNFWPALRKAALAGDDFPMTPGEQIRDFMPVEDVASMFLNAANIPLQPGFPLVANVGTGAPQTLRAFAEFWWKKWEAKGRLLFGAIPYRTGEVPRYVPEICEELANADEQPR
ncbi:MAG: NAD(P)-dependent oxidoreductase [Verrucomicrobiota bacterium]